MAKTKELKKSPFMGALKKKAKKNRHVSFGKKPSRAKERLFLFSAMCRCEGVQ